MVENLVAIELAYINTKHPDFNDAALVASIVPLLLRRLGLDPSLGTPTLVTAIADITGFATFLGLLAWLT